jgi:hypothetical protein
MTYGETAADQTTDRLLHEYPDLDVDPPPHDAHAAALQAA